VSYRHRLDGLERQLGAGDTEPFVFKLATPPAGLSSTEEERWREAHRLECERQGVPWFTLNLGAANVRGCSDEP
jgi:hypothetical protein